MKKLIIPFFFLSAVIYLQACNSSDTKETTATTDSIRDNSTTTADAIKSDTGTNKSVDSSRNNETTNQMASANVDKDAQDFAMKAASGGMMEVALGKVAQQNGGSQAVKDYGKMLEEDHTKAGDELKGIATSKSITIPNDMMPEHKMHVDELSKKTGADFDKAYISMMVDDHNKDIADYKKASMSLKDADLKSFAGKTLPVLQKHLAAAKKLKK